MFLRSPRRLVTASASALVVLLGGLVLLADGHSADAATPGSGSVSAAGKHSVSWTGGPFVVGNPTGQALDAPDCSAPQSCDDYTLKVSAPHRYGKHHQLRITVGWGSTPGADFDIYLLDKGGNSIASAATSANPEQMIVAPKRGTYTVRVVPFTPNGESYTAKASLEKQPPNPPPGKATPPRFKNYAAPKRLPDANNAGEPSIGTSFKSGATLFQSYLSTYRVKFGHHHRAHWRNASASATNGCPQGSTQSLDPILFTDHKTGRTFESQLTGVDSATCYTDDDGRTWLPSQGGGIPSGVDHQSIGGGPFADGATIPPLGYPRAVYYCSQDIATAFCASSVDGGVTFGAGVPAYNLTQCGGLHGHVKVGPDGTAYLPNKSCGANAAVSVSRDNGQTWNVYGVPSSTPGDSDPSVGIGRKGRVFFGYVGADGRPGVAVSTNHGKNWKYGQQVGRDKGVKSAVFPTMVAGDDGRAALAYLGTTSGGDYQNASTFKGVWHLYVSTTYNGGKRWVTRDVTPRNPVQRGSICTAGTTCGNDRNLLDFIDVTLDKHGRVEVAYADGCIAACVHHPKKNGHDAYATIARQTAGRTLFAKFDH